MFVVEVYKDGKFIGYSNGNWDYERGTNDRVPYIIYDMDFNRLPNYTLDEAQDVCNELRDMFIMYDFVINEID